MVSRDHKTSLLVLVHDLLKLVGLVKQSWAGVEAAVIPLIRPTGIIEYSEFTLTLCTLGSFLTPPSDMRC